MMSAALQLAQAEHHGTLDRLGHGLRTGLVPDHFAAEIAQLHRELHDPEAALAHWAAEYRLRVHALLDRLRAAQDAQRHQDVTRGVGLQGEAQASAAENTRRCVRKGKST